LVEGGYRKSEDGNAIGMVSHQRDGADTPHGRRTKRSASAQKRLGFGSQGFADDARRASDSQKERRGHDRQTFRAGEKDRQRGQTSIRDK